MGRVAAAALVWILGGGCGAGSGSPLGEDPPGGAPRPGVSSTVEAAAPRSCWGGEPGPAAASAVAPGDSLVPAPPGCLARRRALEQAPALPGAPGLEAHRAELLGRAKAEPVVFLRAPVQPAAATPEVAHYRALIAGADAPAAVLVDLYPTLRRRPALAREVLLHEGYLYAESPALAVALVDVIELRHLFEAPELILARGGRTLRLRRDELDYRYVDGPDAGAKASLLLLDRVWPAGSEPGPPLHRALDELVEELGVDRVRIERWTEHGVLARLRYGTSGWTPCSTTTARGSRSPASRCGPSRRRRWRTHARSLGGGAPCYGSSGRRSRPPSPRRPLRRADDRGRAAGRQPAPALALGLRPWLGPVPLQRRQVPRLRRGRAPAGPAGLYRLRLRHLRAGERDLVGGARSTPAASGGSPRFLGARHRQPAQRRALRELRLGAPGVVRRLRPPRRGADPLRRARAVLRLPRGARGRLHPRRRGDHPRAARRGGSLSLVLRGRGGPGHRDADPPGRERRAPAPPDLGAGDAQRPQAQHPEPRAAAARVAGGEHGAAPAALLVPASGTGTGATSG
jgi:hypothetical protein